MPTDFTLQSANISIPGLAEIVGSLTFYYKPTKLAITVSPQASQANPTRLTTPTKT